jgi:DNA invertase Pin-like site-specific DNA recombinase
MPWMVGYARAATFEQDMDLQRDALRKAGCQNVFEDIVNGTRAERPGLSQALEGLREGDTLVVWKLDRLGRNAKQLVDLANELNQRGIQFKSLSDAIDTGVPSGKFFFHVMASLAEMERELMVERTRAGLEIARQLGRKGGRTRQMTDSKIESARTLLAKGVHPRDVAKNLGVSVPTLYRWVPATAHPLRAGTSSQS